MNLVEGVAEVYETAMGLYLNRQNAFTFKPVDGNQEGYIARVRLLQRYNFFPPKFKIQ